MGSQHLGEYLAGSMINRLPTPALLGFLLNNTPHVINFRFFHFLNLHDDRMGLYLLDCQIGDGSNLRRFF
jgi:hypothetical protein